MHAVYADFHSEFETDIFAERQTIFDELYRTSMESSQLYLTVHQSLVDLISSVRYIHGHHIAYLSNLIPRVIVKGDYDKMIYFKKALLNRHQN